MITCRYLIFQLRGVDDEVIELSLLIAAFVFFFGFLIADVNRGGNEAPKLLREDFIADIGLELIDSQIVLSQHGLIPALADKRAVLAEDRILENFLCDFG